MKYLFFIASFFFITLNSCNSVKFKENTDEEKPRLVITTDIGGDPDDQQSMVRLLLYSDEFDIEALIASSSGTPGELGKDTVKTGLIRDYVQAYGEVLPSLKKHSDDYPAAEYLLSLIKSGNPHRGIENIGEGRDTEASDYIIKLGDKNDERKLNICIWGGQTDLTQALWKVKNTRSKEEYLEFVSNLRIYDIADQDGLYEYIRAEFPELFYILSKAPEGVDKREAAFRGMYLGGDESLTSGEWIYDNVLIDHGPLGKLYPDETWTAPNPYGVMKEGDTPSWFYFLKNGLQDPEHPEWGGWGGRFEKDSLSFYRDAGDFTGDGIIPRATVYRWRAYFQNDFAARLDRCVNIPENVNHAPNIIISGDRTDNVIHIKATEGEEIALDASSSYDIEGDELEYYWWIYPEAGSNTGCPELKNYTTSSLSLKVPEGEKGKEIHLICEVSDRGQPVLTSFQRIVIKIE